MDKKFYILLMMFSVLVASISQILLKISAKKKYKSFLAEYLNPLVIIAYGMFFLSSFITMFAFRGVPFSLGPVIEATGYIYVGILGVLVLKEKMPIKKLVGNFVIIAGIIFALL
ncbi:MAG: multidrug ABC transporter [Oscillospiraceae bacterium]